MNIYLTHWIAFDDVHNQPLPQNTKEPARDIDPLATAAKTAAEQLFKNLSPESRSNMGLLLGTTLGSLEQDRRFDQSRREQNGRYASPATFTRTLPSTLASDLSIHFHITGPSLVLSAGSASTLLALARAHAWMRHLNLPHCLTGGLDWLGQNITDETNSPAATDRTRGLLCLLSTKPTPTAKKIGNITISPSPLRNPAHLDASMQQLSTALQNPAPQTITADSNDGLSVILSFVDQ